MASLLAPMAGKVIEVSVSEGDTVEVDDVVFIVESMKMETPVFATEGGTVKEIKAKVGEFISDDDVLAVIE